MFCDRRICILNLNRANNIIMVCVLYIYTSRTGDVPQVYVGRKIVCENECRKTCRKIEEMYTETQ